ncbi:related to DCS1 - non-essential hydrolase involved in mRNA decapping [Melanopsichium pennsylvanicum]|uniref:Related to DCS1 - non-essential hydrolase involved in mRNA decapping n=2 Tax=Melanopsichium pennsylvanicum TaxID=63383 RepID=A0AAJ4XJ60_9BASI|nr:related to DCS1 - non-essential hydrolase involved in mRNA decapping [Melanopsichium pennsylvanicum]
MSQINSAPFDELAAENGQVAKLKLIDSDVLDGFKLTQILDQDPKIKSANLLGEFITVASDGTRSAEQAILLVERTHFTDKFYQALGDPTNHPIRFVDTGKEIPEDFKLTDDYLRESLLRDRNIVFDALTDLGQNDIYTWLMAWSHRPEFAPVTQTDADIKLTLIRPATQTHIDKYSAQRKLMVYETPEMYRDKVLPWIRSFPPSRIQWVYNILEHKKESESILFERPDGKNGFIMVPDLKWDQKTPSSLYIQAIVHNRELRSMRDLTKDDVGMLEKVKTEASRVAFERYGLTGRNGGTEGNVRCFLHYQPSYYHLHIHILAASFTSHPGAVVGQAHLLDDVIDLLKLGVDMKQRTLGYSLGTNSKLWSVLYPSTSSDT